MERASSRAGDAGRNTPEQACHADEAGTSPSDGDAGPQEPFRGPLKRPNSRPMGSRCRYEESFLSEEQLVRLCLQKQKPLHCAGQVIILQGLMQRRRWRRADLVHRTSLKRGRISLVLRMECFPENTFWWEASQCLGLKMSRFTKMVEDWVDAQNPGS